MDTLFGIFGSDISSINFGSFGDVRNGKQPILKG
jgi:hypothetical protein